MSGRGCVATKLFVEAGGWARPPPASLCGRLRRAGCCWWPQVSGSSGCHTVPVPQLSGGGSGLTREGTARWALLRTAL